MGETCLFDIYDELCEYNTFIYFQRRVLRPYNFYVWDLKLCELEPCEIVLDKYYMIIMLVWFSWNFVIIVLPDLTYIHDCGVLHAEKICPRGLHILPQRIQLVEYEDSMSGSKGVIACQCINSHLYQGRWGPPKHKISWSSKHHQAKTNIIRTLGLKDNWKSHPNEENRDLYSTLDIF